MLIAAITIILAGCATSPSPWAGIPHQNVQAWRVIGVTPAIARTYMNNGFEPIDAKPWIQFGFDNPNDVIIWRRSGFTPEQARKWAGKGFTPEQAMEMKKKGLTVE